MKRLIAIILLLAIVFMLLLECTNIGRYFFYDTVKINNGDTRMIAHRGSPWLKIENTDAAFEEAGQRSYFAIEADLRITADGRFVVCHDEDMDRIAGEKLLVENLTLKELLEIPLRDKFGRKCQENRLTVLENYVKICKKYDKDCFLELKGDYTKEEILQVAEAFEKENYLHRLTIITFDRQNLINLREVLPHTPAQLLTSEVNEEIIGFLIEYDLDIALKYISFSRKTLESLHREGICVNVWTLNNPFLAVLYRSWGVDYITTNILE